jgi:hypothetical protein
MVNHAFSQGIPKRLSASSRRSDGCIIKDSFGFINIYVYEPPTPLRSRHAGLRIVRDAEITEFIISFSFLLTPEE